MWVALPTPLVAMFTGAFFVFSILALSVAQRVQPVQGAVRVDRVDAVPVRRVRAHPDPLGHQREHVRPSPRAARGDAEQVAGMPIGHQPVVAQVVVPRGVHLAGDPARHQVGA
jgi:hypothetical protein